MREANVERILTHRLHRHLPPGGMESEEVLAERKRCLKEVVYWVTQTFPHKSWVDWMISAAMCMVVFGLIVIAHTLVSHFVTGMPSMFYAAVTTALTGLYLWIATAIVGTQP